MKYLIWTLAALVVVATGLSLVRSTAWWVRAFDFPRPQIALLGLAVAMSLFFVADLRRWTEVALLAVVGLSVLYQGFKILPYTPLYPRQVLAPSGVEEADSLSILVSNVFMENRETRRLLEAIEAWNPDVVLLLETDDWWEEQMRPLERTFPHRLKHPLPNTYGLLFYSKLELLEPAVEFLFDEEIPSVHTDLRLPSGRWVRFHGLHPMPPAPAEADETVQRDGELLRAARRVAAHGGPSIVCGDLNDVAWSRATGLMQRIGGLLDPRIGRGLYSSFHAKIPLFRWPLDHVFHTAHFQLVSLERLPAVGSDHFPIFARLALTPEAEAVQDAPEPEAGDRSLAREKIEEAEEKAQEPADEKQDEQPDEP
jgi:endonuclease/exonuclease/phosphatase (EEP) superfamily protein YafD